MPTFLEPTDRGWRRRELPPIAPQPRSVVDGVWVGLDLGQSADYSALSVVERHLGGDEVPPDGVALEVGQRRPPAYHVRHLQRWQLHTPYPDIVRDVVAMMRHPAVGPPGVASLVVDYTGVGAPLVDLFLRAGLGRQLLACTITAGNDVTLPGPGEVHCPKRDLVSTLAVLLQSGRLKIAKGLPEATTLGQELAGFQVKISAAGRDTYGAWREGAHDDLVLSVALACWAAECDLPGRTRFY
jgi:hypothetical protein